MNALNRLCFFFWGKEKKTISDWQKMGHFILYSTIDIIKYVYGYNFGYKIKPKTDVQYTHLLFELTNLSISPSVDLPICLSIFLLLSPSLPLFLPPSLSPSLILPIGVHLTNWKRYSKKYITNAKKNKKKFLPWEQEK